MRCGKILVLCLSFVMAASFAAADDELPSTGKTGHAVLEPQKAESPVPNSSMSFADQETIDAVRARWERLRKTINRPHRHRPLESDGKALPAAPWMPPTSLGLPDKVDADAFEIRTNTNPTTAAPIGFASTVPEPSVAAGHDYVFYTANWWAAASTDGGALWTYVNPYTGPFAEPPGQSFCCDQQAIYEPGSESVIWLQQLIPTSSTDNGTQRLNVDLDADGTWDCNYDVNPQILGFANASFPDFPDLALSDQYLYMTSNVFSSLTSSFLGAFVVRLNLANVVNCQPASFDYYSDVSFGAFRLTQGASSIMYFADLETLSSIRVWTWPDANLAPTFVTRAVTAFLNTARSCPGPDARDWCGFIDARIQGAAVAGDLVAFFWVPSQNPGAGFPYPYTQGVVLDAALGLAVDSEPLIWSSSIAWVYPSAAANAAGGFGGTIMAGGGALYPSCVAWLADAANGFTFGPLENSLVILGSSGPSSNRSGDYLTTRVYHPYDQAYASTCFAYPTPSASEDHFVLFGRLGAFPIFTDGFESGNTSAWSSTVP